MNFQGKQALIIEDDQTSINVLQNLLSQHQVTTAVIYASADIATNLQELAAPLDVIFLDLEMPGANGYAVHKIIRESEQFDGVPIIAYTTHISHMNETQRSGFNGFLGKPLDPDTFPEQLNRIFNGESVWEAR